MQPDYGEGVLQSSHLDCHARARPLGSKEAGAPRSKPGMTIRAGRLRGGIRQLTAGEQRRLAGAAGLRHGSTRCGGVASVGPTLPTTAAGPCARGGFATQIAHLRVGAGVRDGCRGYLAGARADPGFVAFAREIHCQDHPRPNERRICRRSFLSFVRPVRRHWTVRRRRRSAAGMVLLPSPIKPPPPCDICTGLARAPEFPIQ